MDTTILRQILSRMSERTKIIAVALIAFAAGSLIKGSGDTGRFIPFGASGTTILDSKTGTAWTIESAGYKRLASFSYWSS
ncbi:MAG TPA: hypothetical protein VHY22_05380 [Chthoniobacteraceae bacterium]|jgi:hypothetical protein|nr:hypothetical protein [Chthoniobacteraceae bacterium]